MEKPAKKNNKQRNPFEDYMWMENMEEFDRQVEEELYEEEFIRTCIDQLLDEEEERETMSVEDILAEQSLKITNPNPPAPQQYFINALNNNRNAYQSGFDAYSQRILSTSKLNPNAKVFIPSGVKTSS